MGTKTISITDNAYRKLASLKKQNESFSMVIERITGKSALSDIAGILSTTQAAALKKSIESHRKKDDILREKRMKKIEEALSDGMS